MSTSNGCGVSLKSRLQCRGQHLASSLSQLLTYRASLVTATGLLCVSVIGHTTASSLQTVEYCSSDTLAINCRQPGLVILVARALYGRMSAGKCITSTYGESLGCRADVLSQLDEHCSGRTNCSMLVAVFDSLIQPCPRDFKSYLEVSYECVPVSYLGDCSSSSSSSSHSPASEPAAAATAGALTSRRGYLALYQRPSANRNDRWKNRRSCVWSLRAERGQQISVSWRLPSAAGARDVGGQAPRRPVVPCPATIVFVDGHDEDENTGRPPDGGHHDHGSTAPLHATTCSVGARNEPRLIYTSKTNQLYVRLTVGYIDRTSPQLSIGFYHLSVVPGGLHLNQDKPAVCPTHRYHPSQTAAARSC